MSSDVVIKIDHLSKCYHIYDYPHDRLKQFFLPKLQSILRIQPRKYYREFWAVKEVSIEIKRGETIGIIGRNGSGKSTLLQMICGTLHPTSGTVYSRGRIAALLELGSGFNPEFTGRENVYMNGAILGLSPSEISSRFNEIEIFADIGDFIDQPVKTYSSGMLVRLAFAVIAHVDADILVIDEALAVGDAFFTQKCMRFLRDFMANGTVIFVSHDSGSIRNLCTRAFWLEKGCVVESGSPKDVCANYLRAYYELQQGDSQIAYSVIESQHKVSHKKESFDQRLKFINSTALRNDIQVFDFEDGANSFGKGDAVIIDVSILDEDDNRLIWVVGGELVKIRVTVKAIASIFSPIIGFSIRDKLGQPLFGDNTYLSHLDHPHVADAGQKIMANFVFYMPILPVGDYSLNVAIATGTQENHIQQHWIHEALFFKSVSTSLSTGLIGIPMLDISLDVSEF